VPKPTVAKAGKRAPRGTVDPALRELLTKSKAPHTAEEMVELLAGKGVKVTASGLRLHLDAMVKDGELKVVGTRSAKGRGRAAKIFQPTGLMV
jgi:predicted ArsR family transcriptional regulator